MAPRMTAFIKAKLKKSDGQNYEYSVSTQKILQNIIS